MAQLAPLCLRCSSAAAIADEHKSWSCLSGFNYLIKEYYIWQIFAIRYCTFPPWLIKSLLANFINQKCHKRKNCTFATEVSLIAHLQAAVTTVIARWRISTFPLPPLYCCIHFPCTRRCRGTAWLYFCRLLLHTTTKRCRYREHSMWMRIVWDLHPPHGPPLLYPAKVVHSHGIL